MKPEEFPPFDPEKSYSGDPPFRPVDEAVVTEGAEAFSDLCIANLRETIGASGYIGPPLVTKTDRWGLVWRADMDTHPDAEFRLFHRVVCWIPAGCRLSSSWTPWQEDTRRLDLDTSERDRGQVGRTV